MKVEYISFYEVTQAYFDCRKHKRNTKQQLDFELNLWQNLYSIYRDLNRFNYTLSESISFIVSKPVYREVFAAMFRDRIIHHILYNKINHIFESHIFIDDCYACRKGKGTLYGIKRCADKIRECSHDYTKSCYILKGDIKSFFMTIDKRALYRITTHVITKYGGFKENDLLFIDYVLKLIIFNCPQKHCICHGSEKLRHKLPADKSLFNCDVNHGIPIGNLMSQILANLFLSVLDWYVVKDLGCKFYGRYVDDFYIIHPDKNFLLDCKKNIKNKLEALGVTLHPKKVYLQHYTKGIRFLGAIIKPNRIYVNNRIKGNFTHKLYLMSQRNACNQSNLLKWRNTINSYLGLLSQFKTYNIRKKYILKYHCLNTGFFYIKNDFISLKVRNKYK